MNIGEKSIELHKAHKGKIEIHSKVEVDDFEMLSLAYSPGVAAPCLEIEKNAENAYVYTNKANTVAVISDGSAVLGLGNIGANAAMPVMEGKAVLFKKFAGIDAIPLCIDTQDTEAFIATVGYLSTNFGGINLEDISAPRCFEIEKRLKEKLPIPVFHDDQHGTAIVVGAALLNALKLVNKQKENIKVVISGAGSAGISIAKLLLEIGIKDIVLVDKKGVLCVGEPWMNEYQTMMAKLTNINNEKGDLKSIIKDKDVFIGVSAPNIVDANMVSTMNEDAIVFALANPVCEIMPEEAKKGGARVVATGRSDYPNQVNNALVFPGIFKGALEARALKISEKMKVVCVYALSEIIKENELCEDYIIPSIFDERVVEAVSKAVSKVAIQEGVVRTDGISY